MRLALGRDLAVHFRRVLGDIAVVFLHEAALHDVVVGQILEARVPCTLLEPVAGLLEVLAGIPDVTGRVAGRSRVVAVGQPFDTAESIQGAVGVSVHEAGVGLLEEEFRHIPLCQIFFGNVGEGQAGISIVPVIKAVQAVLELDLGYETGVGPVGQVGLTFKGVVAVHLFGTEQRVALVDGVVPFQRGEDVPSLAVKAFLVEVHRAVEFGRAWLGVGGREREEGGGQGRCYLFEVHIERFVPRFRISADRCGHYFTKIKKFSLIFVKDALNNCAKHLYHGKQSACHPFR